MRGRASRRTAGIILFGFVASVYLFNIVIFSATKEVQMAAGGLFMIALGGAWVYLAGGPETLTCDRARNTCRVTKPRFLLTPETVQTFPFDRLRAARVSEVYLPSHDGPGGTGYEVVLETKDRGVYVFSAGRSRQSADRIAGRIRAFLKEPGRESLTVRRFPWAVTAAGWALLVFGLLTLLGAASGLPFAI